MIKFQQKITGAERKVIAAIIAEVTGQSLKYAGVPSYAYEIAGWKIDRDSLLHSPEVDGTENLEFEQVLKAFSLVGLNAEGDVSITFNAEATTEATRQNLSALIMSKANLLAKSLSRPTGQDWAVCGEEHLVFSFFNATLDADLIKTYITMAEKLLAQATSLKYCTAKEKEVENEKYAFRCFLLRLGFIGSKYKVERKLLLKNLAGNTAFKSGNAQIEEEARNDEETDS